MDALVRQSTGAMVNLLPAVIFLVGCGLAFATGTSWGTFGILIPIVVEAFSETDQGLMIIAISACMAGAVCGDHCRPHLGHHHHGQRGRPVRPREPRVPPRLPYA